MKKEILTLFLSEEEMPPPSLSKFKVSHKQINTKWPLFPNKVNSLFQHNIFLAHITDSLLIKLNQQILTVKLRNGPKLILELELLLTIQTKIKLFSLTERNTLIKPLLLLQASITVILMLKDSQKWELDQKRTMSTFICWTIRKPLLETTTMDGTIKVETWSAILQKLHTRVKEMISMLSTTNHGWDKIKSKEDILSPLKSNTGLQTKKSINLVTLTKLLLKNATREESRLCLDGNFWKFTPVKSEKRLPLSKMLTVEKLSNQVSDTETLTHQVNHGKTSSMVELLMPMVWLM